MDSSLTPFAWSKLQDAKHLNKFFLCDSDVHLKKNFKKVKKKPWFLEIHKRKAIQCLKSPFY